MVKNQQSDDGRHLQNFGEQINAENLALRFGKWEGLPAAGDIQHSYQKFQIEADSIDIGESAQNCQNLPNDDDNESVKEILYGTEGIVDQEAKQQP